MKRGRWSFWASALSLFARVTGLRRGWHIGGRPPVVGPCAVPGRRGTMKTFFTMGLVLVGASALVTSCFSQSRPARDDGPMGGIQLGLDVLSGGLTLAQATYTIN